jgi:hypothetical protein
MAVNDTQNYVYLSYHVNFSQEIVCQNILSVCQIVS